MTPGMAAFEARLRQELLLSIPKHALNLKLFLVEKIDSIYDRGDVDAGTKVPAGRNVGRTGGLGSGRNLALLLLQTPSTIPSLLLCQPF